MEEDGSAPEEDLDDEPQVAAPLKSDSNEDTAIESMKAADLKELEAAKKERMDLMAAELKKEREMQEKEAKKAGKNGDGAVELDVSTKFQFLLGQSEVFAHFLAGELRLIVIECETSCGRRLHDLSCHGPGSVATSQKSKRSKKSGRGKANRMTEAEEDAALMKTATSARRTVYLNSQPKTLADHCKMRKYQLEGLNWMIKLHDHGINGILADEMG